MSSYGRNEPCPCGSGKKFKKCCIDKPEYRWRSSIPAVTVRKSGGSTNAFKMKWSISKVRSISTDHILDRLKAFGVAVTAADIRSQIDHVESAQEISEIWFPGDQVLTLDEDTEFPQLAAQVLWERLRTDKHSLEFYDDLMHDGYDCEMRYDERGAFKLWWELWQFLLKYAERRGVRDWDELDQLL